MSLFEINSNMSTKSSVKYLVTIGITLYNLPVVLDYGVKGSFLLVPQVFYKIAFGYFLYLTNLSWHIYGEKSIGPVISSNQLKNR